MDKDYGNLPSDQIRRNAHRKMGVNGNKPILMSLTDKERTMTKQTQKTCRIDCGFRARIDGLWTCITCGRKHKDSGDPR